MWKMWGFFMKEKKCFCLLTYKRFSSFTDDRRKSLKYIIVSSFLLHIVFFQIKDIHNVSSVRCTNSNENREQEAKLHQVRWFIGLCAY